MGRARPTPGAAGARVWARSGALTFALKYGLHSSIRIHPFYVKFAHKASGYEAITCRFGDFTPRTGSPALGSLKMQRAPRGEGWASPGRRGPAPSPAAPLPPRPPPPRASAGPAAHAGEGRQGSSAVIVATVALFGFLFDSGAAESPPHGGSRVPAAEALPGGRPPRVPAGAPGLRLP